MTIRHKRDIAEIQREADRLIALQKSGKLPLLDTGGVPPLGIFLKHFGPDSPCPLIRPFAALAYLNATESENKTKQSRAKSFVFRESSSDEGGDGALGELAANWQC